MDQCAQSTPLVSVCIPTRNGEEFLKAALDSVLAQDYPNMEVVVSDDGSTDDTLGIVREFIGKGAIPARLYHHDCQGIGANWNYCVTRARGKYIKFLMQDDVLAQGCVTNMVAAAESHPTIGLVYCRRRVILSGEVDALDRWLCICGSLHDKFQMPIHHGLHDGRRILSDERFIDSPRNKIGEPTVVMFPARVVETVGSFREDLVQTLDYEYWYRILKQYDAFFIDEELAQFRRHEKQATTINARDKKLQNKEMTRLWAAYMKNFFFLLAPSVRRKLLRLWVDGMIAQVADRGRRLSLRW